MLQPRTLVGVLGDTLIMIATLIIASLAIVTVRASLDLGGRLLTARTRRFGPVTLGRIGQSDERAQQRVALVQRAYLRNGRPTEHRRALRRP